MWGPTARKSGDDTLISAVCSSSMEGKDTPWLTIVDEKGELEGPSSRAVILGLARKVANWDGSRWQGPSVELEERRRRFDEREEFWPCSIGLFHRSSRS